MAHTNIQIEMNIDRTSEVHYFTAVLMNFDNILSRILSSESKIPSCTKFKSVLDPCAPSNMLLKIFKKVNFTYPYNNFFRVSL